jgi:hypothetical protein
MYTHKKGSVKSFFFVTGKWRVDGEGSTNQAGNHKKKKNQKVKVKSRLAAAVCVFPSATA